MANNKTHKTIKTLITLC